MAYDPRPSLRSFDIPVLAVFGDRDVQLVATQNVLAMEAVSAGNPRAKVMGDWLAEVTRCVMVDQANAYPASPRCTSHHQWN